MDLQCFNLQSVKSTGKKQAACISQCFAVHANEQLDTLNSMRDIEYCMRPLASEFRFQHILIHRDIKL